MKQGQPFKPPHFILLKPETVLMPPMLVDYVHTLPCTYHFLSKEETRQVLLTKRYNLVECPEDLP